MKIIKNLLCVLITAVMIISASSCSKAPDDEYTPDVGGDEQGTPLFTKGLSVDTLYALENLEITPWEFVETYTPGSVNGNEYFYRMKNGFELTLTLGESWKDTYIRLYDTMRDSSWSLCRNNNEDVYSAVSFHQTKKHVHTITTSSADGSAEVTSNTYYSFVLGGSTGEYRAESDPKEDELIVNRSIHILPEQERFPYDGGEKVEYYHTRDSIVWHPTDNIFATIGWKTLYTSYNTKDHAGYSQETLFTYIYIYDCDTNEETMIKTDTFESRYTDIPNKDIMFNEMLWSPCGRYLAMEIELYSREGEPHVIIYDTETGEVISGDGLEIVSYGYYGRFQHLCPPELDWEKAYSVIEANRAAE